MNALKPIQSILPEEEFAKLDAIKEELHDAWQKNQIFRTETQAEFVVLNDLKYPTKAAKYWQSVREQMAHFDELVRASFLIRRKEIELKEVDSNLLRATDLLKEKLLIDRDEILYDLANAKRVAKDRVREVVMWSDLKNKVNDGSFDDKNVNTHQKESLFQTVFHKSRVVDPTKASAEEKLSIKGIIKMLRDEPENAKFLEECGIK